MQCSNRDRIMEIGVSERLAQGTVSGMACVDRVADSARPPKIPSLIDVRKHSPRLDPSYQRPNAGAAPVRLRVKTVETKQYSLPSSRLQAADSHRRPLAG